jgi:hypothetical protein
MAKTYKGKSLAPGGGGKFARLKDKLMTQGKSSGEAGAIAASIGRRKYGVKKMATWSSQGRKRSRNGK